MALDTKETIAALHRTNTTARTRKMALNEIIRESRNASSLELLRAEIERIVAHCEMIEREAISK